MILPKIEPATFRFVVQGLNQLRQRLCVQGNVSDFPTNKCARYIENKSENNGKSKSCNLNLTYKQEFYLLSGPIILLNKNKYAKK